MEAWLEIVVRQIILYSLPLLVSLTGISLLESKLTGKTAPHPLYSISWGGSWLPLLASIFLTRGIIIALPQPLGGGQRPALIRAGGHLLLCIIGFFLYSWSLNHEPQTGLPPLHHWWSKVLMFFNLCMLAMHLLPLPGQWVGEMILKRWPKQLMPFTSKSSFVIGIYTILAASPFPDLILGPTLVYPLYKVLAGLA